MKDKILMMIIGILVGAIVTTIGFYIFVKLNNTKRMNNMPNMENRQMMERPNGEMPPEMPNGNISEGNI